VDGLPSIRTFYRVLAALGESKERRNQPTSGPVRQTLAHRDGAQPGLDLKKVMRTGFQWHLEKPVAAADLITEVARLAGRLTSAPSE
jgi:hypothetical protein